MFILLYYAYLFYPLLLTSFAYLIFSFNTLYFLYCFVYCFYFFNVLFLTTVILVSSFPYCFYFSMFFLLYCSYLFYVLSSYPLLLSHGNSGFRILVGMQTKVFRQRGSLTRSASLQLVRSSLVSCILSLFCH